MRPVIQARKTPLMSGRRGSCRRCNGNWMSGNRAGVACGRAHRHRRLGRSTATLLVTRPPGAPVPLSPRLWASPRRTETSGSVHYHWGCAAAGGQGKASRRAVALIGFQGRGFADVVQPNCRHPFLLEALLLQWSSIRKGASRTMMEQKPPESNKSDVSNDTCDCSSAPYSSPTLACYTAAIRSDGKTQCVAAPCHRSPARAHAEERA